MAWSVELFHLVSPHVDFPQVFITKELGDAERVRQAITEALPSVQWSGDRGYVVEATGPGAEVILWRDGAGAVEWGSVDRITVNIEGEGDPMDIIAPLCLMHGWNACDSSLKLLDAESEVRTIWSRRSGTLV